MSIVFDIGHEIRDLVNEPRRKGLLMRDDARWSQVCVCMDVISDTEQAIRGYLAQTTTDHDILYLTTYGVLQAFVVQQDAVFHVASALGHPVDGWGAKQQARMDWTRHPELLGIRNARIRAAGHPSKTNGGKAGPEGYHVIVQHSLQVGYFEMMSWNGADDARVQVDVTKLAADQRDRVGGLLARLRDGLVEDDREHKAMFQGERLTALFKGTGYAFEKIIGALRVKGTDPMAEGGLAVLEQSLEKFRRALDARERPSDSVDWIYSELAFPLAKVRQALDERSSSNEDEKRNAYCLAHFVRLRFDELKGIAAELDADYQLVTSAPLPAPTSDSAPPT
jgi:hypothetical protein